MNRPFCDEKSGFEDLPFSKTVMLPKTEERFHGGFMKTKKMLLVS